MWGWIILAWFSWQVWDSPMWAWYFLILATISWFGRCADGRRRQD